jgi:ubiquinone/menaquinone biosynthesis C-methylase UbiE
MPGYDRCNHLTRERAVNDRSVFIRETLRRTWSQRTHDYAAAAAGHGAHTAMLIAKVQPQPGERVLDVGTGSGVVAVAAAQAVGPAGHVLATDFIPDWGEIVADACREARIENVEFRAMDAEALDLQDDSFDIALSQFTLMFVPRPVDALREMRRVLRKDGRLGIAVWSTMDRVEHQDVGKRVLAGYLPPPPPGERLPGATELGQAGLIERLVTEAGFRHVDVDRQTLETTYESFEAYWQHQVFSEQARADVASMPIEQRERLRGEMMTALAEHRRGERLHFMSEAVYVTAVR